MDRAGEAGFADPADRFAHAEKILTMISRQAVRAMEITKRLGMIYEKAPSEGEEPARVSVRETWQKTVLALRLSCQLPEVEMVEHLPEPFPSLRCCPHDFETILYTLAKNAVEAMKGKGKLVIRAELAYSTREEPFVIVKLADTGPGIEEGNLGNLFQPFFTTKPEREGNGLGLFLVKKLVSKNGGRITVSTFQGCGTAFHLEFPLASPSTLLSSPHALGGDQ